jgi:hypothetical protein
LRVAHAAAGGAGRVDRGLPLLCLGFSVGGELGRSLLRRAGVARRLEMLDRHPALALVSDLVDQARVFPR